MRLGQILLDAAIMGVIGISTILAFLASTFATINFFITSNPFEVVGPVFAVMWLLMVAVLFSPAIGALYWRRRRLRSRLPS